MLIIHDYIAEPGTLNEFADYHHLQLIIQKALDTYRVRFMNTRMRLANGSTVPVEGYGATPQKAIDDYAEKISGTLLQVITSTDAIDNPSKHNEHIVVPDITGEPT